MRRFAILTFFLQVYFQCFGQSKLEYFLAKGDSLRVESAYRESFPYYDSASNQALEKLNISSYLRALIGKGYALRLDRDNQNYEGAYQLFFQALTLSNESADVSKEIRQDLYYGLAITERMRGNFEVAMEYGDLALLWAKQMNNEDLVSRCYNMLANIQAYQGNYELAIQNIEQAIELRAEREFDNELPHWYYNLGYIYSWNNDLEKSNSNFKRALSMFEALSRYDSSTITNIEQEIARNFVDLNHLDSARIFYQKAQENRKISQEEGYQQSYHYGQLGNMHLKFKEYDSALFYFQKSLSTGIKKFNPQSVLDNPIIPTAPSKEWLLNPFIYETLELKGQSLVELYTLSDSSKYLLSAYELYEQTVLLLQKLRSEFDENDPSLHLAGHVKELHIKALEVADLLATSEEHVPRLMNSVFNYIEQIKHSILLRYVSNDFGRGEELELARSINAIQKQIDDLRRQIVEAKINESTGYRNIEKLITEVIDLRNNKKQIIAQIDTEDQKPEEKTRSLGEVKNFLSENQLLITYFWGEKYIYGLAVSRSSEFFSRVELEGLDLHIKSYLEAASTLKFEEGKESYTKFTKSAYIIYKNLVAPFLDGIVRSEEIQELVIVPDGKINMVPFGALITNEVTDDNINYRNLDYLMREYLISYGFSSSLFMLNNTTQDKASSLVGFSSDHLRGTQKELSGIKELWSEDAKMYYDSESTESSFKTIATQYDIIHIASHASSGDFGKQPSISFYEDSVSSEDGNLYSYEIYPLDLSNSLTVLSACETGLGRLYEGEGVFSLARGFAFAGSASIVTSLWKVKDAQTTQLMTSFYEHLTNGENIKTSLHNAQLDYLNSSDPISAHPSLWSSFILIGNGNDELFSEGSSAITFLLIFLPIIISVVFLLRWRNSNTSKNSFQTSQNP